MIFSFEKSSRSRGRLGKKEFISRQDNLKREKKAQRMRNADAKRDIWADEI
jgi:hypothetical protein